MDLVHHIVRDVLDLTAEGVLITNPEGWVTYANAMVLSMFGHDHTQVVGQRVRDLFDEEDVDLADFLEAIEGVHEWTGEIGDARWKMDHPFMMLTG